MCLLGSFEDFVRNIYSILMFVTVLNEKQNSNSSRFALNSILNNLSVDNFITFVKKVFYFILENLETNVHEILYPPQTRWL